MRLSRVVCVIGSSPLSAQVVRGGVEPPPATYQIAMLPLHYRTTNQSLSRDGRTRTDTLVLPRHVGLPLPYIPLFRVLAVSSSYGS
jgi:hypothetical protein